MKIRNGFVSNSSSSSFVLVGIKLSQEEVEAKYDDLDNFYNEKFFDTLYDDYSGSFYAGNELVFSSDNIENTEIELKDLMYDKKAIAAIENFDKTKNDIKLFVGTVVT
jgi:hypothetical protein